MFSENKYHNNQSKNFILEILSERLLSAMNTLSCQRTFHLEKKGKNTALFLFGALKEFEDCFYLFIKGNIELNGKLSYLHYEKPEILDFTLTRNVVLKLI